MATALIAPPAPAAPTPPVPEQEQFGGDGFPELPKDLQTALKGLLRKVLQRELYARRQEVMEARKQRFYDRGVQYIYWDFKSWGFAPLSSVGYGDSHQEDSYEDVYNIYHPFLRALEAALTANPVGAHIEPRTNRTADTIGAEAADQYREYVEQSNDIKHVQMEVARYFGTDGRVIVEVETSEPDIRYGVGEDGQPLTAELIRVYGVLESKVPITQNKMERWPYCVLSEEFEVEWLQDEYPDAVNEQGDSLIRDSGDSSGESAYERMARIGVLQGTRLITASGETWKNLATRHRAYFRPSMFRACDKATREQLEEAFPDGCLYIQCGDAYCGSWNVSMDKRIRVAHSTPGDGQNRSSLMHDMVGPQDTFNDCWNQQKEIFDYCIPEVYMDTASLDALAREERQAQPGAEVPVVLGPGETIQSKVLFGQNVEVPATMIQALETIQGPLGQFITGAFSALLGAGDEHQETYKGLQLLNNQALGQVGIAWGYSQQLIAEALELCVRLAAETREPGEKIPVKSQDSNSSDSDTIVEMANVQKGNWYSEVDTSFPDTRAMKRAVFNSLWTLAQHNPALQAILTLPENQKLFRDYVGIDGLEVPGAAADLQQRREIEDLLMIPAPSEQEMQTIVTQMAQKAVQTMQPGMPPPPPPTPDIVQQQIIQQDVPVDMVWDYHQQHIQTIQDWLASQDRYDEEAKGNQQGIENVKLHGMIHKQALAAAQQPPQGKPPSVSINFADLPPDGKVEAAQEAGIKLNPAGVIQQEVAKQPPKPPQGAMNA